MKHVFVQEATLIRHDSALSARPSVSHPILRAIFPDRALHGLNPLEYQSCSPALIIAALLWAAQASKHKQLPGDFVKHEAVTGDRITSETSLPSVPAARKCYGHVASQVELLPVTPQFLCLLQTLGSRCQLPRYAQNEHQFTKAASLAIIDLTHSTDLVVPQASEHLYPAKVERC